MSLVVSVPKNGRRKNRKKMFSMGNSIKRSVGKPTTRWKGVVQKDALQILGIRGCRRQLGLRKMEMPFEGGHVPSRSCSAIRGWMEGVSVRTNFQYYDSNDGV